MCEAGSGRAWWGLEAGSAIDTRWVAGIPHLERGTGPRGLNKAARAPDDHGDHALRGIQAWLAVLG